MEVICNPTLRAAAGVQWRRAGASAMPIADLFRVMSACFDRKISFSGCNGVAGVPYFQTDRCGGKINDDSSTVKNCHASSGKIIMQNLNTQHQFSDESS
ncbi:hypothetical protein T12_10848 [Trichinella patagoniensis]|uniref:Uncharacterized protein n=1 Tax=Trichinella patagoniensis TaxID=990121 RepID=A0A0V1A5P9_9BILA|nr:hypothetical protein T12_10848 [Trichinella patagoniensis]